MDVKFEKLCQALVEAEVPLERSDQSVPVFFLCFFCGVDVPGFLLKKRVVCFGLKKTVLSEMTTKMLDENLTQMLQLCVYVYLYI